MSECITDGKVVYFHYTLTNPEGEILDSSQDREPLGYLHGAQNIVPGLEQQLTGRSVGESLTAVVPPASGYGIRNDEAVHSLPKSAFPEDMEIHPGMPIALEAEGGAVVHCFIISIEEETVVLDANHPLAGVTLHFDVEITGMRDANEEEKQHGHPHEPGQPHH